MQNAMRAHLAAPIPPELGEISAVLSLAPVHTLAASPSPAAAPSLAAVPGPVAAKRTSSMAAITAPAARRAAHRLPPDTIVSTTTFTGRLTRSSYEVPLFDVLNVSTAVQYDVVES